MDKVEEGPAFSGYCLDNNLTAMYELLRIVVVETDFHQPTKLNVMVLEGIAGAPISREFPAYCNYFSQGSRILNEKTLASFLETLPKTTAPVAPNSGFEFDPDTAETFSCFHTKYHAASISASHS